MSGTIIDGLMKTETEVVHGKLVRYYDPESSPPRMTKSELHLPTGGILEQRWRAWGRDRDWPTREAAWEDRRPYEDNPYHCNSIFTRFVTPWKNDSHRPTRTD